MTILAGQDTIECNALSPQCNIGVRWGIFSGLLSRQIYIHTSFYSMYINKRYADKIYIFFHIQIVVSVYQTATIIV